MNDPDVCFNALTEDRPDGAAGTAVLQDHLVRAIMIGQVDRKALRDRAYARAERRSNGCQRTKIELSGPKSKNRELQRT